MHMKNNVMMVVQSVLLVMMMLGLMAPSQTNALIPYNPISPSSLLDHMMIDDPFRTLEQTPFTVPNPTKVVQQALALARADWKETATAHVILLDVPGLKKEDVNIEVEENRVLRISGERKADDREGELQGDNYKWHRAERTNGKFWRQFRLPGNADLDQIKAHLEDGVLKITVPKLAAEKKRQPKLINIASSSSSADHGADVEPPRFADLGSWKLVLFVIEADICPPLCFLGTIINPYTPDSGRDICQFCCFQDPLDRKLTVVVSRLYAQHLQIRG